MAGGGVEGVDVVVDTGTGWVRRCSIGLPGVAPSQGPLLPLSVDEHDLWEAEQLRY